MELHQIRYFLAACETLNFTRAAEMRHVSQPALTKAIHMLEDELGGALFDTQSRPIRLTAFGALLRGQFAQIHDILLDIKTTAKRFHMLEDSTFAIGILNTIGQNRFVEIVRRLQEHLLGVSITITHIGQNQLIEALNSGKLELAIVPWCPGFASQIEGAELYEEPYMLAVPDKHRFAQAPSVALADLDKEGFVQRSHCEQITEIRDILTAKKISMELHLDTDQDGFAKLMIGAGLGVGIMPQSLITPPLVGVPIDDLGVSRAFHIAHKKGRSLSPIAEKVFETLAALHQK